MLALATTNGLTILDPAVLKRSSCPAAVPSSSPLHTKPTSSAWAPDTSDLFISSARTIQRYDTSSNILLELFSQTDEDPISHIVSKDKATMNEATAGDIVSIACSPFSKSLVAVATSGGILGLVDLDKEKGLFRNINIKIPLTTVTFSPEGGAVYLGTENGKLMVMDLRTLDKPPKSVIISDTGDRVETIAIQKKPTTKPGTKAAASPAQMRTARAAPVASPMRKIPPAAKARPKPEPAKKKVFSPVRDPHGNTGSSGDISVQLETLGIKLGPRSPPIVHRTPKSPEADPVRSSASSTRGTTTEAPRRARTATSTSATRKPSTTKPPTTSNDDLKPESASSRPRTASSSSRAGSSASRRPSRTVSSASRPTSSLSQHPPTTSAPPVPALPTSRTPSPDLLDPRGASSRPRIASSSSRVGSSASRHPSRAVSSASRPTSSLSQHPPTTSVPPVPALPTSRTPSPDLPDPRADPMTPVPAGRKPIAVLGLGTPEVARWIEAGKGGSENNRKMDAGGGAKGKSVGFEREPSDGGDDDESHDGRNDERAKTMQVSPRRPQMETSSSWAASPVRHPIPPSPAGGGSAHELLRNIVRDVMCDFQLETKAEITGLHLDL
ncbi:hypothetical protein BD779DRAFT_1807525, partial [Infundibulicybe gibba]